MSIFAIQTNEVYADGQRKYVTIETGIPDLLHLATELRNGPLTVMQVFAKRAEGEEGVWIVTHRRQLLITWHYIFNAYVPETRRYVEYENVVAPEDDKPAEPPPPPPDRMEVKNGGAGGQD